MSDQQLRELARAAASGGVDEALELAAAYERAGRSLDAHQALWPHRAASAVRRRLGERWLRDRCLVNLRTKPKVLWKRRFTGAHRWLGRPTMLGQANVSEDSVVDLMTGEDASPVLPPGTHWGPWVLRKSSGKLEVEDLASGLVTRTKMRGEPMLQALVDHAPGQPAPLCAMWRKKLYGYVLDDQGRLEPSWEAENGEWDHSVPWTFGPNATLVEARREHLQLLAPDGGLVKDWTLSRDSFLLGVIDGRALISEAQAGLLILRASGPRVGLNVGPVWSPFEVTPNHVLVSSQDDQLVLLRRPTLEVVWTHALPSQPVFALGEREVYYSNEGVLIALDLSTREVLWELPLNKLAKSSLRAIRTGPGRLYVMLGNYWLFCLGN